MFLHGGEDLLGQVVALLGEVGLLVVLAIAAALGLIVLLALLLGLFAADGSRLQNRTNLQIEYFYLEWPGQSRGIQETCTNCSSS